MCEVMWLPPGLLGVNIEEVSRRGPPLHGTAAGPHLALHVADAGSAGSDYDDAEKAVAQNNPELRLVGEQQALKPFHDIPPETA